MLFVKYKNSKIIAMNKDTVQKLGFKIRMERQKAKISQEKMAELAGMSKNSVSLIERGKTNATISNIESIANVLKLDIRELFNFVI